MISHLHHINFIVRDLKSAVHRYQKTLGFGEFIYDSLDTRGVITARIMVGDTWIVLVQPTDSTSKPGQYLERHGEGFFLLSFATDRLNDMLNASNQAIEKRYGLENWQVADFPEDKFFGAQFQLTQELTEQH